MGTKTPIPVVVDQDHQGHEIQNAVIVSPTINTSVDGTALNKYVDGGIPTNLNSCDDTKFASTKAVRAAILGGSGQIIKPNGLVYGAVIWSGTGLVFYVTACKYYFQGVEYNTEPTIITFDGADSVLNRIDVPYVDNQGDIGILKGSLNANPSKPNVDPFTQIELTFVYIGAGSVTPVNITTSIVYDENIEWVGENLNVDTTVAFDDTTSPFRGTKCIKLNDAAIPLEFSYSLTNVTPISIEGGQLIFRIKLVVNADSQSELAIGIGNGNLSTVLNIHTNNSWGLDYNSSVWQTVVIPFSEFIACPASIDIIAFKGVIGGGTIAYFDAIELQVGNNNPTANITLTGAVTGQGNSIIPVTFIDDIKFEYADIVVGTIQTYTLDLSASYKYKIKALILEVDTGTLTGISVQIPNMDSTVIGSVTTTDSTSIDIVDSYVVNIGDKVVLYTSVDYSGAPTILSGKLVIERY